MAKRLENKVKKQVQFAIIPIQEVWGQGQVRLRSGHPPEFFGLTSHKCVVITITIVLCTDIKELSEMKNMHVFARAHVCVCDHLLSLHPGRSCCCEESCM